MRTFSVGAVSVFSLLALSACGHHHGGAARANVVSAKISAPIHQTSGPEARAALRGIERKLLELSFDGLSDFYLVEALQKRITGYTAAERREIVSLLNDAKDAAQVLLETPGEDQGREYKKIGKLYWKRAAKGLKAMRRQERDENDAKRGILTPYFGSDESN